MNACQGKNSRTVCREGVCVYGTMHEEAGVPQELGCSVTLPHTQSLHLFYLCPL